MVMNRKTEPGKAGQANVEANSLWEGMAMNHMPFDEGAVTDTFQAVLGIPTLNKTTKAMCGKRVPVARADHKADTTCPDCQTALLTKWRAEKWLREYLAATR